jgi:NTE family protein
VDQLRDRTSQDRGQPRAALVLTGGGARAAYQVGFLRFLARQASGARIPVITGVSAGAINAVYIASHRGSLPDAIEGLYDLWRNLEPDEVYGVGSASLMRSVGRWGLRLFSGGARNVPEPRGLLDSSPLERLLNRALSVVDGEVQGIDERLGSGELHAVAVSTLDYTTGRTVTWVQGRDVNAWERPRRQGVLTRMTIGHIMASAALPFVFPAVRIAESWHGDGGIRLATPLAPAVHLGADRIIAISTRYQETPDEAAIPKVSGYPPPAQIAGIMLNSMFLDAVDLDARNMERINRLLSTGDCGETTEYRPIDVLVLRPSTDLGRLAGDYETKLPRTFRFLTRGLGTRQTESPDFLSLLMFQPDYLRRLIEIGEADAEAKAAEITEILGT